MKKKNKKFLWMNSKHKCFLTWIERGMGIAEIFSDEWAYFFEFLGKRSIIASQLFVLK